MHKLIVKFIHWYLARKCGGACHVNKYGKDGRYIVVMSEEQYHDFTWKVL